MKIYFAGSIRGGNDDAALYARIITLLSSYGSVLTEHVGLPGLLKKEKGRLKAEIYEEDMSWLKSADAVVAEISTPSLGVGYEIGRAEGMGKPVLCIHHLADTISISAMMIGNASMPVKQYSNPEELVEAFDQFFGEISVA